VAARPGRVRGARRAEGGGVGAPPPARPEWSAAEPLPKERYMVDPATCADAPQTAIHKAISLPREYPSLTSGRRPSVPPMCPGPSGEVGPVGVRHWGPGTTRVWAGQSRRRWSGARGWSVSTWPLLRTANVEPVVRSDGTKVRSVMLLESQPRPEAYRRVGQRRALPGAGRARGAPRP
jgi:hypothetical protein